MEKDAQYVRVGLQQGILKFRTVIRVGNSNEFSYYCPDKKVWEETGYFRDVSQAVYIKLGKDVVKMDRYISMEGS